MKEPVPHADEKVVSSLLLAVMILAGIALLREGRQYDNVIEGWRFFNTVFFSGALVGFFAWTQAFHIVPKLSLKRADRQPWLAAITLALIVTVAASWLNRSFTTPTDRSIVAEIDELIEAKNDRWHLSAKHADGTYQRYQIPKDAAAALQNRKTVRMEISRGALGFDLITRFAADQ